MAKLSRIAKYEDLRNRMQNDAEADIKSHDLSEFANKLNKIDSNIFRPMETVDASKHDPIHARRDHYLNMNTTSIPKVPASNFSSSFDNEYLDEYINEVKQYNKEQGTRSIDDTSKNILKEIYGNSMDTSIPEKPYKTSDASCNIPFVKSVNNPYHSLSDDDLEKTRNDIANEVKNLINTDIPYSQLVSDTSSEVLQQIEIEQNHRKKITEETNKMKLQMDEYEDNLNEFEDKVENTSRILNFILIIVIFVLIVVLGFVVYWVLLNRGIIK